MNKITFNWLTGALFMLAAATTISSCSDDHFTVDSGVSGRQTLWESIVTNDNLSEYADILSRVHYSKSKGNTTPESYARLFSNDQKFTVWAPQNGTFQYEYWKSLLDDGTMESAYKVETELIRNNMTRFNHLVSGNSAQKLKLFSGKSVVFDCANAMIKNQHITQPNIGAKNGTLHITDGAIEYQPNLYEYLAIAADIDTLNTYIKGFEEIVFDEDQSTQGPIIDGNVTYVDSITYISNEFLNNYMNAYLNEEDSSYAVIMPTNEAWKKAYKRIATYFNYQKEYTQDIVSLDGEVGDLSTTKRTTRFSEQEIDSMVRTFTSSSIAANLAFNTNAQFGHTVDEYAQPGACDSLRNTVYAVFKDPISATLFDGASPVEVSNGYAFIVQNYNIPDTLTFLSKRDYRAENMLIKYDATKSEKPLSDECVYYGYTDAEGKYHQLDSVLTISTLHVIPKGNSQPNVTFRLPNTYSCKYDIYVVTAYNKNAGYPYQFRAALTYHNNNSTARSTNLTVPAGVLGSGNKFETHPLVDETGVHFRDSVLVAQDFDLPVCYFNMSSDAYITLQITGVAAARSEYTNDMYIEKIVLVPKMRDDE